MFLYLLLFFFSSHCALTSLSIVHEHVNSKDSCVVIVFSCHREGARLLSHLFTVIIQVQEVRVESKLKGHSERTYTFVLTYIYIYMYRQREGERGRSKSDFFFQLHSSFSSLIVGLKNALHVTVHYKVLLFIQVVSTVTRVDSKVRKGNERVRRNRMKLSFQHKMTMRGKYRDSERGGDHFTMIFLSFSEVMSIVWTSG